MKTSLLFLITIIILFFVVFSCNSSSDNDDDDDSSGDDDDDDDTLQPYCENDECLVPGGEFEMGCPNNDSACLSNERPQHAVTLSPFFIDQYEVTNSRYVAYMNANNMGNDCGGTICMESAHLHDSLGIYYENESWTVDEGYEDRPVAFVTWFGAREYCLAQNKSLPTEAQWELAAKGLTDDFQYPWGASFSNNAANYSDSGDPFETGHHPWTSPIGYYDGSDHDGQYATTNGKSPYGLYDMAGNVEEWVQDWYDEAHYNQTPENGWVDPVGPENGEFRVLRGGSWGDAANDLRTTYRSSMDPEGFSVAAGFRCARPYQE